MFSRPSFYFMKNSSVLRILAQTNLSRPSILATPRPSTITKILSIWKPVRNYSSVSLKSEDFNYNANLTLLKEDRSYENFKAYSDKKVGYWLLGTSTLVFGIVVLGGLTRLTESGLSITEWKPVTGALPPLSQEQWVAEFEKYQDSPEFRQLNSHITLEEFKFIYSMEWGHRLVGRGIGMFFVLPALYFWKTGKFNKRVGLRVLGLTGLLGLQGVIGWWMVRSGLDEQQLTERNSKPTVSQYRLTAHLGAAFLMYLGVLWTGMEILNENKLIKAAAESPNKIKILLEKINNPALKRFRTIAAGLLAISFITAMSGGMVAGLDAGLIYNTFPHMGDNYVPSVNELMSPIFSRKEDRSDLWWRNILENPTTVQLVHRIFATTTFFAVLGTHILCARNKMLFPASAMKLNRALMGVVTLQATLGICTLIYLVPIPLAAAHQAGALALLTTSLIFVANLKKPRPEMISYINKIMQHQLTKLKGAEVKV